MLSIAVLARQQRPMLWVFAICTASRRPQGESVASGCGVWMAAATRAVCGPHGLKQTLVPKQGMLVMEILSTRFGPLQVEADDVLVFPTGLPGLDACQRWALVADDELELAPEAEDELAGPAWLQSLDDATVALAVVCPRQFVPDYQLRVSQKELAPLQLDDLSQAQVLLVVAARDGQLTVNLKAPLVINPAARLGRQVIANGDYSVHHPLLAEPAPLRKSA